jgi:hypothetical protein
MFKLSATAPSAFLYGLMRQILHGTLLKMAGARDNASLARARAKTCRLIGRAL